MQRSITIGVVWGIPLKIQINWFLIAAVVTWSLAAGYFPQEHPGWSQRNYWLVGMLTASLFFGSVLLHELGHSLLALREGVPVNSITLFVFGGIAHIAHEPETPGSEFRIVLAGPLTSLGLAGFFYALGSLFTKFSELGAASFYLSQINLILAVFNMLPGFPLDGGRVLRSILWHWMKDFFRATRWAVRTGLFVAVVFIMAGVTLMIWGNYFNGIWVAFVGWYLGMASRNGYRQSVVEERGAQETLETGFHPGDVPTRPLAVPVLSQHKRPRVGAPAGVLQTSLFFSQAAEHPVKPAHVTDQKPSSREESERPGGRGA